ARRPTGDRRAWPGDLASLFTTGDMTPMEKTLLLLGETSDIGRATAQRYAEAGWRILLAARDVEAAERNARDIAARTGASVSVHPFDVLDAGGFAAFIERLPAPPNTVVCVLRTLGGEPPGEREMAHRTTIPRTNFEGPAPVL